MKRNSVKRLSDQIKQKNNENDDHNCGDEYGRPIFLASRLCPIMILTPGENQSKTNRPITPISSLSQVASGSMVLR